MNKIKNFKKYGNFYYYLGVIPTCFKTLLGNQILANSTKPRRKVIDRVSRVIFFICFC